MYSVISQLAELFWQLEYSETAAVTPTIELAKLALVTSRDEEEEEGEKGGTDSSNDTDATLVDDTPSRFPSSDEPSMPPAISPGSVLGKRTRDVEKQLSEMDIDSPTSEGFVIISSPGQANFPPLKEGGSSSKIREASSAHDNDDVEMDSDPKSTPQKRPPLPPRKPTAVSDSTMMFGKVVFSVLLLLSWSLMEG
jgi:ubiquitin carboxyl-terminal hydrolase 25/28